MIYIKIKEKIKEWLFSSEMLRIKQLEKQIEESTSRLRSASIQLGNSEKEIAANPEKFGFNRAASEGVEGYDARLMNEMDANNFRKAAAEARSKDVQKAFGEEKALAGSGL